MKLRLASKPFFDELQLQLYATKNMSVFGDFRTAFKGEGLEYADSRPYTWGDNVRAINWTLLARYSSLFVKEYEEDRNRYNIIILDCTPSMFFRSGPVSKMEKGLQTALMLLYTSLKSHDNTAFLLFTDRIVSLFPFSKKITYFHTIFSFLRNCTIDSVEHDSFGEVLEKVFHLLTKRSNIFIISDFAVENAERQISSLAGRHTVTGIRIWDMLEEDLITRGIGIHSIENKEQALTDDIMATYAKLRELLGKSGSDYLQVSTVENPFPLLQSYFREKIGRMQ